APARQAEAGRKGKAHGAQDAATCEQPAGEEHGAKHRGDHRELLRRPGEACLSQANAEWNLARLLPARLEILERPLDLLAARALVALVLPLGSWLGLGHGGAAVLRLLLARQQGIDKDPCQAADGGGGREARASICMFMTAPYF